MLAATSNVQHTRAMSFLHALLAVDAAARGRASVAVNNISANMNRNNASLPRAGD